jgi:hypothetical protein
MNFEFLWIMNYDEFYELWIMMNLWIMNYVEFYEFYEV